ncbi:hypothetical protein AAF712_014946 [Marasmius tenuissimus]|uniref:Uncharacterized protein n=1 Tax=Marasmius tenuissimus TaxID=585030 RepID=A0ABR2ZAW5_9AGAR
MIKPNLIAGSLLLLAAQAIAITSQFIPKRYIVEIEENHALFARDESPAHIHKRMHNYLEARGLRYETRHEYGSPGVLVGLSLTIKDESDLHKLHSIPGVKAVHPLRMLQIPDPAQASSSIAKREAYAAYDPKNAPFTDTLHAITGVDKLHAKGITGKGIKIGIIDTGVDYNHPALGNGYGEGHKIIGGHDFVGDLEDLTLPLEPDNDPMDCQGHGTHVTGIIGASPGIAPFNLTGVAYDAEISVYKVAGCGRNTDPDATVAALIKADQEGNDVINLSLGGPSGWTGDFQSVVASRIAGKGRIVTISAGNEGLDGAWYASRPGTGEDVISVASVDTPRFPLQVVDVGGDTPHDPIPYFDPLPLTNISDKALPIYAFTNDTMEFGCATLTDAVPNLENHVVVTRTGSCAVSDLMENLSTKGAKIVFLYSGTPLFSSIRQTVGDFPVPVSKIPREAGEWLTKQFFETKEVTITFPKGGRLVNYEQQTGGLVATTSTYGPSFDLRFKPSVGAHGGEVLSTYPLAKGGYIVIPGTSMAAPYLAGCAALYLQVRGNNADIARQARNFFESTSVMVPESHEENSMLQSVTSQGAGLVNAYAAAYTETYVWPGELLLNDTRHFRGTQNFTVKNLGSKEKKYDVTHIPAGTAITIQPGSIQAARGPVNLTDSYAEVELSSASFTLAPHESKIITVKFTPPQGLDNKTLPVYSGFIQVEAQGDGEEEKVHVSYMGVAGSLFDQKVLDDTDDVQKGLNFPAIVIDQQEDGKLIAQKKATTFEFEGNETFPQLGVRLAFGSPQFDIEFVDASVDLNKVIGSKIPVVGSLFNNQTGMPRNILASPNTGFFPFSLNNNVAFRNGTLVPDGTYKILVRALRVTGNRDNLNDWDMWLSPAMTFKFNETARAAFASDSDDKNVDTPGTRSAGSLLL